MKSPGPVPILFVHHRPELGGAPQSLYYLLRELDRDLYEPHVYCPPGPSAEVFRATGAIVHEGPVATFTHIWASTYRGRRWLLLLYELSHLPAHVLAFARVLRSTPFALVHLNDSPLVPAAWLAQRAGIPVVWHLRSALPDGGRDRRSALLRAAIRRLASAAIAINDDVARSFDVGAVVVPNAVDLERFSPSDAGEARATLELPEGRPVVSYFGFIYPSKGFREFIESASLLHRRGIEATYLIVGGGVRGDAFFSTAFGRALQVAGMARDYQREAEGLVRELGLEGAVRFIPFIPDTARIFQASDIVVAPSRGPEIGRPVLEASACGRVIVASGSREGAGLVRPDETGLLVPRRSPDALAAAIEQLLEDPVLRRRLGANARRHARENFDPARNAAHVGALYGRVLGAS
jgi:glycosyltransferase involved in cell wall biosynthesis